MKKLYLLFAFVSFALRAQLPDSDIWLFELGKTKKGIILKKGTNVTKRSGYDNQPFFTPDNKQMLFVSIRDDGQSDVYRYELGSRKTIRVTVTNTSEYSPLITPDGKFISVVKVEQDSTQRVWKFSSDFKKHKEIAEADQQLITSAQDSIGYYAWLNADTILYYKLTDPHSLRALSLSDQKDVWIADSPTRAFNWCGPKRFFYAVKKSDSTEVRVYDWRLKKSEPLVLAAKENEDFIWHKTLGLLKSDKSKLMRFDEQLKTWLELADLSTFGINRITRFAISANGKWLAVVSNK